jgi:hypothetical protein
MSSLTSNLLLDPIEELRQVLSINAFGLAPSPATQIILDSSFPITDEDKVRVAEDAVRKGETEARVKGKAKVGLLEGDILEVSLDKRGYTVCSPPTPVCMTGAELIGSSNRLLRRHRESTLRRRTNRSRLCLLVFRQHTSRQ